MSVVLDPADPTPRFPADSGPLPSQASSVDVVRLDQLSDASRRLWQDLRATHAEFRTPFFSLAFCEAVQATRGDVWVAILSDQHQPVGFLPFHRIGQVAVPVGRYFNDAHNVICHPQTTFDWTWLLAQCGVKAFDFHALVGSAKNLLPEHVQVTTESFSAQLGNDPESFLRNLERDHNTIRRQEQKSRKMARELGPLTLQFDCQDPHLLEQTIGWKRSQYRRTNILDLFTPQWTRDLVCRLHHPADDRARGILSLLWAGDQVVAGHYGMIENGLLHYWFPAYNPAFAKYSPGTALFKELVRSSSQHGIDCIDMGYGEQPYKRKQTGTVSTVAAGCISGSVVYRQWKRVTQVASGVLKKVPMKERLKHLLRRVQPNAGISKIS